MSSVQWRAAICGRPRQSRRVVERVAGRVLARVQRMRHRFEAKRDFEAIDRIHRAVPIELLRRPEGLVRAFTAEARVRLEDRSISRHRGLQPPDCHAVAPHDHVLVIQQLGRSPVRILCRLQIDLARPDDRSRAVEEAHRRTRADKPLEPCAGGTIRVQDL